MFMAILREIPTRWNSAIKSKDATALRAELQTLRIANPQGWFSGLFFLGDRVVRGIPGVPTIRIKQGGAVTAASLIQRVQPEYPTNAKAQHVSGTVRLHAVIDTDGSVRQLEVVSGNPLLVQSGLDAVRNWRYRSTTLDGEPVEVDTAIDVIYSLGSL